MVGILVVLGGLGLAFALMHANARDEADEATAKARGSALGPEESEDEEDEDEEEDEEDDSDDDECDAGPKTLREGRRA